MIQGRSHNRIVEKDRHLLFRWGVRGCLRVSTGRIPRKLTGYKTVRVRFLIILEVPLTTWNSDYFVPFWQYHYGLHVTRTLTSLTTQTDVSWTDGWSCFFIPFKTLMQKGITKCIEVTLGTFIHHELFIVFQLHKFMKSLLAHVCVYA